jgi:predicted AlkP superfamily pyrophosphatase or phosphodiesterase
MAQDTAVILIVGLSRSLLAWAPRLSAWSRRGTVRSLRPVLPAVTCSVQASMLTGLPPRAHGIVGNGWYDRELAEVHFWKQSNRLVSGEKVWETARRRDPAVTCANVCWWFNMNSTVDYAVTPRPMYKADGRKIPDCYTQPADLRARLQAELGVFPLFQFWGPGASIASSRWIADAARLVHTWHRPTLNLAYLPHLDYALQKLGPGHAGIPHAVAEVDAVAGDLIDYFDAQGVKVLIVSEYGIEPATAPIHINRVLRAQGGLAVREEEGLEWLDPCASQAFAVADHQVAHVYVRDPAQVERIAGLCRGIRGVAQVLPRGAQGAWGIDHARAGGLVLTAQPGHWFTYYYWHDDARAPDFARTVDIHRKPGYDPAELFLDPRRAFPRAAVAWKLLRRRLGFRTLLDVIPLDASLVRGTHGRIDPAPPEASRPLLIAPGALRADSGELPCAAVRDVILEGMFG